MEAGLVLPGEVRNRSSSIFSRSSQWLTAHCYHRHCAKADTAQEVFGDSEDTDVPLYYYYKNCVSFLAASDPATKMNVCQVRRQKKGEDQICVLIALTPAAVGELRRGLRRRRYLWRLLLGARQCSQRCRLWMSASRQAAQLILTSCSHGRQQAQPAHRLSLHHEIIKSLHPFPGLNSLSYRCDASFPTS